MVLISATPPPRPPGEEFDVVYSALARHVLAEAEARGDHDISVPHPDLATAPSWAIPREVLMALPDEEFVANCFISILDRPGSAAEIAGRVEKLREGTLQREELVRVLSNAIEVARAGRRVRLV